jgi:hypothetical protein
MLSCEWDTLLNPPEEHSGLDVCVHLCDLDPIDGAHIIVNHLRAVSI